MKEQSKNKFSKLELDSIAEQWVNIVLAQIKDKKQKLNKPEIGDDIREV